MAWKEPTKNGWRVRDRVNGRVVTVKHCDTETEADALVGGYTLTLGGVGQKWLDVRERSGVAAIRTDRSRWEHHVEADPIARTPLVELRRRHVLDWLDRMRAKGLATQTVKNTLNLLRQALTWCADHELLPGNPAQGVTLRRREGRTPEEKWTFLVPSEQAALLDSLPNEDARIIVGTAIGLGCSQAEQWGLTRDDVDLDGRAIVIRRSKTGKRRRVPLFGIGLAYVRRAYARAEGRGHDYLFPGKGGRQRAPGEPKHWHDWVSGAGIDRRVRWHDLRHTCGTSLVAGWWGRKWTLDEVRDYLGHSSVTQTERYAHAVDDTLRSAARSTGWIKDGASYRSRTDDLRFTKTQDDSVFVGISVALAQVDTDRLREIQDGIRDSCLDALHHALHRDEDAGLAALARCAALMNERDDARADDWEAA